MERSGSRPVTASSLVNLSERQVLIDGELTAVSPSGIETRLQAAGDSLNWHVDDIGALSGLPNFGRAENARFADVLAERGISLTIGDDSGAILEIGHGNRSFLGRVFAGSRHIRPRRLWGLLSLRLSQR